MALTDENMQDLQAVTKKKAGTAEGKHIRDGAGKEYEVVASMDGTTQGIAVAPIVNGKADYSQTAVVVAGTQPPGDKMGNGLGAEVGSTVRAFIQGEYGYSMQGKDVEKLYQKTETNLKDHGGGEITNMSGHSQAGPAVAKVASKHNVDRVTNFSDWGAGAAYASGYITKKDKKYLDKHAYIYSDSKNDTTKYAADGGHIPYGHVREVEGSNHSTQHARIKGNHVDTDYYVKHHQFCSGMTKEQAREVAKYKAKHDHNSSKSTQDYLDEYNDTYGSFKKKRKVKKTGHSPKGLSIDKNGLKTASVSTLAKRLASASGSEKILLKKGLLTALASDIKEDVQAQEKKVTRKQERAKEKVEKIIERTRTQALVIAKTLPAGEVEALLSELSLGQVWQSGVEAENESQAHQFTSKVIQLSENLKVAADRIEETDKEDAQQIKLL